MKKLFLMLSVTFIFTTSFYLNTESTFTTKRSSTENKEKAGLPVTSSKSETNTSLDLYNSIDFNGSNKLNVDVFEKALRGYANLKKYGKLDDAAQLLTIGDFSLSSTQKRLWVIDLHSKKVLFNTLVAHGKNTGDEFAANFSNTESSLQSSIGFYLTEATYNGENGYSLRLLGLDKGYNDNALKRAIVMHGADYVSEDFIKAHRRIGRSWGCPAVSRELAEPIINTIKGQNVLFVYYPDQRYLESSQWLNS